MKFVHIGLPKCSSTTLQDVILKKVSQITKIEYIYLKDFTNRISKEHILKNSENIYKILPSNFIISDESLFAKSWEFVDIEYSFNLMKKNFQKDTIILIILRNPYNFLNSIFLNSISELIINKPNNFFYFNNKQTSKIRDQKNYNLVDFSYDKLIKLYKSYFQKVIVIKYENLEDLQFLKLFKINDNDISNLKKNYKNHILNRSLSKLSINILIFLSKFINLRNYKKLIDKLILKKKNIIFRIINRLIYQFDINNILKRRIDIFYRKKYFIDKKYIPIDIDNIVDEYNKKKY
tara:strand:+ start:256 stop:1131 length:876 start_codon:yes stop_codon:yes gene_type:complete